MSEILLTKQAAPTNPTAGKIAIYVNSAGNAIARDENGVETPLASGSDTFISINVGGNTDVTLSASQLAFGLYEFNGTLTGNINVIFSTRTRSFHVDNVTAGAFTLTCKTSGQVGGVIVPQGKTMSLYCNGTIIEDAGSSKEDSSNKDASGGYAGLTLFKINFKNALNTFTSFFTNSNTAARTYTFQDRDGTIADNTDLDSRLTAGSNLISGCLLSVNADPTKFDISPGSFHFTNSYTDPANPVHTHITYAGSSANAVTNLATQDSTYISIDSAGTIYQTLTKPNGGDTRDRVLLGALVHTNRTSITSADSSTDVVAIDLPNCLADISLAVGIISEGNLYSGNATNPLRLNKSSGYFTQIGVNWKNDKKNPNRITAPASSGATHLATWRNGTGGWVTAAKTDVIPSRYDDGTGGVTQPSGVLAVNKWQLIKIFYLPNSQVTGIEYGQVVYNSEAEAEAARSTPTTDNPALASIPFRGWLIVRGGATDLKAASDARFIDSGKFGQLTSGVGSGSSTTTLQGSYDNSTQPQITTSTTGGAVQVKRGTASDADAVFQILNGAGTPVFTVTGTGAGTEYTSNKDASGGYVGLTLFKINFKNALNTFTSFLTNSNTATRTYTFQDRDGTIADNTDLAGKAALAGSASQTFSVAPATAAAHAVRSDQLSSNNTDYPIYTPPTSYATTLAASSGAFTSAVASMTILSIGKKRTAFFTIVITTNGTAAGSITLTIPVASNINSTGATRENSVTGVLGQVYVVSSSSVLTIVTSGNTYPGGNGYTIFGSIEYYVA